MAKSLAVAPASDQQNAPSVEEMEEQLKLMADGDFECWTSKDSPEDIRKSNMQDILDFESVGTGTSLFQGLQEHGIDLPRPETLNEKQSAAKVIEIVQALACLRIFLIGFEHMTPREAYATIWNETLWEGCYFEKRNPEACTLIDVSHCLPREDVLRFLKELAGSDSVH